VKLIYGLVGAAALLFVVGGVGVIASFVAGFGAGTRLTFMYIFLAGLIPGMAFLLISLGIGLYHLYLYRVAHRTPTGWLASERSERDE
jgi:hypothetical protein